MMFNYTTNDVKYNQHQEDWPPAANDAAPNWWSVVMNIYAQAYRNNIGE